MTKYKLKSVTEVRQTKASFYSLLLVDKGNDDKKQIERRDLFETTI